MFRYIEKEQSKNMKATADVERSNYARYLWEKACELNTFSDQDFMDG